MATTFFHLRCLICGDPEEKITPEYPDKNNLVALQEHAMELHGITREELRATTSRSMDGFQYTLPDGRDWMLALEEAA